MELREDGFIVMPSGGALTGLAMSAPFSIHPFLVSSDHLSDRFVWIVSIAS